MQQEKYDVVVVGAGIGGLGAGALLAHSGYKTLVIEKRDLVGGRFSSYDYEGFTLPTGAVTVHYKGTETEQLFKETGAELELVDVPGLYYRIEGRDYEMPAKGALGIGLDIISKLEEDKAKVLGGFAKAMSKEKIMGAFRILHFFWSQIHTDQRDIPTHPFFVFEPPIRADALIRDAEDAEDPEDGFTMALFPFSRKNLSVSASPGGRQTEGSGRF